MQDSSLGTPQSSPGSAPSFGDSFSSHQSGSSVRGRDRDSESESDFSAKVSGFEDNDDESTVGSEATSMADSSIVAGSAASDRQNVNLIHGEFETAETSTQEDSSTEGDSEEDEYGDGDTLSGIQSDSQSTLESTESTTQSSSSRSTISGVMKQPAAGAFLTQITRDFSHGQRTYTTNIRPGPGISLRGAAMGGVHVSRLSRATLDSESSGVLHAVSSGDMSLLKEELKGGETNQRVTDSNRRTPLHVACSLGRLEMVKLFVDMGMNVDACSMTGQTPLHEACIGGHYSVLKLLLSRVSDLDVVDSNGLSAAHYCALNGEAKCLDILCEQVS